MIELLEQLMEIIKGMPQLAIWVLAGILLYKVIIVGSIFGVLKLLILKGHDAIVSPKRTTYELNGLAIDVDTSIKLNHLKDELLMDARGRKWDYIHESQVDFALTAIREKREAQS